MIMRPKMILIGPIVSNAILRAMKELAQIKVAIKTANVPMVSSLVNFTFVNFLAKISGHYSRFN